MLGRLRNLFARKPSAEVQALRARVAELTVKGKFDVAQTTDENVKLWELTDYYSSKTANSFQVRRLARMRCRYEVENNSYARGITLTLANDLVGTGPRLQVRTKNKPANKRVQLAFARWAKDIKLAEKLLTMKLAKVQDGEAFGLFVTNRESPNVVQLDIKIIEADQVTTPMQGLKDDNWVDGVILDEMGDAKAYNVLKKHPGDLYSMIVNPLDYETYAKRQILHWYRKDRPGQVRGMPEIHPAIHHFAKLRMFCKAVMEAATTAAGFSVLLETQYPADVVDQLQPFDVAQIERNMMTTLPAGVKASQMRSEQPATNYEMFVRLTLREIARCLNVPFNIAAGDSSSFNYSSGRLDHLSYHRQMNVERAGLEALLDRVFHAWLDEAVMIPGLLPDGFGIEDVPHRWFWDRLESIDPEKDSAADASDLDNLLGTLEEKWAERGEDWEDALDQLEIERARKEKAGLLSAENAQSDAKNGSTLTRKDVRRLAEAMRDSRELLEASAA